MDITQQIEDASREQQDLGSEGDLESLSALVEQANDLEREMSDLQDQLKERAGKLERILGDLLPTQMDSVGLQTIRTPSGRAVEITTLYGATLGKGKGEDETAHQKRRSEAFAHLRDHGHGGMIKNVVTVNVGRGEDEAAAALMALAKELNLTATRKEDVHAGTLKAWVRDQSENGDHPPEDLFRTTEFRRAKITGSKK